MGMKKVLAVEDFFYGLTFGRKTLRALSVSQW